MLNTLKNWLRPLLQLTNVKALQAFHLMRQGATILTAILLAKSYLPTAAIGNYEQLLYISYAVSFFWVSGLIQGLLTSFSDESEEDQPAYLFNAYLVFGGISLFFFLVLLGFQQPALELFTGKDSLPYFRLYLVYMLFNMPTYLVENIYLLLGQPKRIFQFGFFSFGGHLVAMLVPVFLGYDFIWSFYGLVGLSLSKHAWLWFLLTQKSKAQVRWDLIRPWVILSLPLMGYALLGGLMQTFDNWLVNYWYDGDERTFAIFRYGARELPLALALAHAFSTAMLPEVRENLDQALTSIREKSRKLFHLLFPISIVLLATSTWFFPIVFNADFIESVPVFNTYLLIIFSRLVFSRTVLVGLKDNTVVLWISVIELLVNIGASFLLIDWFGLTGVALATVLAYSLEKLLICGYLYRKHGIGVRRYVDLRWWTGYTLVLWAVYVWQMW